MDLGRLDHVIGADRAFQLALHGPQFLDVENELGLAQRVGLVENLPADRAPGGQALLGQHHPGVFDLGGVDENGRTTALERIGNAGGVELAADFGGFLEIKTGEKELLPAFAALQHDDAQPAAHKGDDDERRCNAHAAGSGQLADQSLGIFWFDVRHARPENCLRRDLRLGRKFPVRGKWRVKTRDRSG